MLRHVILPCLLLLAAPAWSQPAVVAGRVVDADGGEGLPGANVFLSGTTRGAATDADGAFSFSAPALGDVELVATVLGYEAGVRSVRLTAGRTIEVELRLQASDLSLGEVRVEARPSRDWRRTLRRFERVFLGASRNARQTKLVNPEVLDFQREGSRLLAVSRAPLIVDNEALGYRLTLLRLRLNATNDAWAWRSPLQYEDLPSASSEAVQAARLETYLGSVRHFLAALVAGRVREEGFQVRAPSQPGSQAHTAALTPEQLARLVTAEATLDGYRVASASPLQVTYTRESDPRPGAGRRTRQLSWLVFERGSIRVDAEGRSLDADPVTRYGYWDWERAADLLPADYTPADGASD